MGQAPRPALKPPQANAGMGPQPQMGQPQISPGAGYSSQQMQQIQQAGGLGAVASGFAGPRPITSNGQTRTPTMPGGVPPQQGGSYPMQARTPQAGGVPAATQTPPWATQQRMQQQAGLGSQPMGQQIQGAIQQQRGTPGPMNPAVSPQNAPPRPYNMTPSGGANTTMARPMYIPPDMPTQKPSPAPQAQQSQPQAQPMMNYGGQPTIDAGPVYSQQQQDQLINQAVGQNGMQAATNRQSMMSSLGAAGFAGGGSPKAMALENQIRAAQMGADNAARTGIPLQLAETNAKHLLASQQAQENQYSNRQNERLTGQGQQLGFMQGLMGSLLTY
jgi:hypothetical protein